jgi:glycosyltransferase involved in cell wall biosynthesis
LVDVTHGRSGFHLGCIETGESSIMRILHAVTLVSDDGSFGGPVSVATAQLAALRERGHDVCLAALWAGPGAPPTSVDSVPLRAASARTFVPRTGFLGKFNFRYGRILWNSIGHAEVVHVHTGRDLASLAALSTAWVRRKPVVVQTHGMVDVRTGSTARLFDVALRPLIRRASACLVLTASEGESLATVLRRPPILRQLANGVRPRPHGTHPRVDRAPTVLFLARLQARKRPVAFVQAAEIALRSMPDVRFDIYGPDEGALGEVEQEIARLDLSGAVRYHGPVNHEQAQEITAAADVYVLPSVREPFPMSLLEALAVGTPVVCTTSTGISEELDRRGAAVVTDGSPDQLASGIVAILGDESVRQRLVAAGDGAVSEVFSIDAVAAVLEQVYRDAATPAARVSTRR